MAHLHSHLGFPLLFENSQRIKKSTVAVHCCPGCLVVWPPFSQQHWLAFQESYVSTRIKSKSLPFPMDPKAHAVQITKINSKYSVSSFYLERWVQAHACIKDFCMKKLKLRELFLGVNHTEGTCLSKSKLHTVKFITPGCDTETKNTFMCHCSLAVPSLLNTLLAKAKVIPGWNYSCTKDSNRNKSWKETSPRRQEYQNGNRGANTSILL